MKHYDFAQAFRTLHERAVRLYAKGQRDAATYFTSDESAWLIANGLMAQNLYDYAEDFNGDHGEPGPDHALAIEFVRRSYFLETQRGEASTHALEVGTLPAKTEAVRGIEWLPRLIPKAKAKLRGELPATLMYCCAGDRKFFKQHDILPAEFMLVVWSHEKDDAAIVEWVLRRIAAARDQVAA